jgi:hypothetical protein
MSLVMNDVRNCPTAQIPPARSADTRETKKMILRMVSGTGGRWSRAGVAYVKVLREARCRITPPRASPVRRRAGSGGVRGQPRVTVDEPVVGFPSVNGGVVGRPPRRPVKNVGICPDVTHHTTPAARATVRERITTVSTAGV